VQFEEKTRLAFSGRMQSSGRVAHFLFLGCDLCVLRLLYYNDSTYHKVNIDQRTKNEALDYFRLVEKHI